jgi:malate dehydrogenase (oxaloacetate-decarboxylating)
VRKLSIDTVFRLRLLHRPGQLARVADAVASQGAMLGDLVTVRSGERHTLRDVTVETDSAEQTERVRAALTRVDGCEVLSTEDMVFAAHRGGKIGLTSRLRLESVNDLRRIYTPGVARVSRAIQAEPSLAWDYTWLPSTIGIFTNGTRVLGLGDIGTLAALPVMEGKAALYERLAGLTAIPILVDTKDPEEFIRTVVRIAPGFGGIHLEDIRIPDCFHIEDELIRRLPKPVMHDDQHGTATAALAALLNVSRLVGRDLRTARVGQIGLGAAGSAIARLMMRYGVPEVLGFDVSEPARARAETFGIRCVDLDTLMEQADVVVATTGRAGLIRPEQVRRGQVLFALSNPDPEIAPDVAIAAGAAYAADGRSINNALAFPGIFKGALSVRSSRITPEMLVAAAEAIAGATDGRSIVPSPLDPAVHVAVTKAVAEAARAQGLAETIRVTGERT